MSVDVRIYEFSKLWLAASGYTYEMDARKLTELVQDVCQDFKTELENGPQD